MLAGHAQRFSIVASYLSFGLCNGKLSAGGFHLVAPVVDEPQGADGRNGKRDAVCPLGGNRRVWRVSAAMVEAEKEDDEDGLIEELAPALHEECAGDLSAAVQTVVFCRNPSGSNGVFHAGGGGHGVLTTDANAVEEERPDVADNPAVLGHAPCGREHDQAEKHDHCVLDQTETTTDPRLVSWRFFST